MSAVKVYSFIVEQVGERGFFEQMGELPDPRGRGFSYTIDIENISGVVTNGSVYQEDEITAIVRLKAHCKDRLKYFEKLDEINALRLKVGNLKAAKKHNIKVIRISDLNSTSTVDNPLREFEFSATFTIYNDLPRT